MHDLMFSLNPQCLKKLILALIFLVIGPLKIRCTDSLASHFPLCPGVIYHMRANCLV